MAPGAEEQKKWHLVSRANFNDVLDNRPGRGKGLWVGRG